MDTAEAALELADLLAWHVFPCRVGGKAPATARGCHDATTDPDTIRGWFDGTGYNLAIACGPSRLVVVDIDDPDSWETFTAGRPVETCAAATPSGGMHLYFQAPDHFEVRNSASKLAPGVDVRASGGYVVAPPSTTPAGEYRWLNSMLPAELPGWLADALRPPPPPARPMFAIRRPRGPGYAEAALAGEADRVRAAVEGTRNHKLNEAAFRLGTLVGAGELDPSTVAAELLAAARAVGLDDHEAAATIRSGLAAGIDNPRTEAA